MSEIKIVYIASPYSGDLERNAEFAREACRYCIEQGYTPIAPHLYIPQILDDCEPEQRELGLELGKKLLTVCGELWLCGDRISDGMYAEMLEAMSLKIPHRRITAEEILSPQPEFGMGAMSL